LQILKRQLLYVLLSKKSGFGLIIFRFAAFGDEALLRPAAFGDEALLRPEDFGV